MRLSTKADCEFRLYIYQVILQLACKIISFDDIIYISRYNEHGIMQPLAPDVLGISKTPGQLK